MLRREPPRAPNPGEPTVQPASTLRRWLGRFGGTLALAMLAGVLAGLAAAALHAALHAATPLLVGRFADLGGPAILRVRPEILFLPALGALASGLFVQGLLRIPPGHGTHQLVHAFHRRDGVLPLPGPAARAAACVGVIACGGSAGPEGPIAGLGAAIGSTLGRALELTPRARRVLLVAGCAAGVGAIFRCPLGGALFACSILYRRPELEASALVAAFIASAVGYASFSSFTGFGGFLIADADRLAFASALELPVYVALGVFCGAAAIVLSTLTKRSEAAFAALRSVPLWLRPALGGLAAGALACALPQVMDGEYRTIRNVLDGSFFAGAERGPAAWALLLFALVLAKALATAFTVGSGAAGGVLGPSLWIGGCVGAALGAASEWLVPGALPEAVKSALIPVGMGGVLAAALRTPIAAIVMVMEMTGGYGLIVPLMVVCMSAYLVCARHGLIDEQVPGSADSPAHAGDAVVGLLERARVHEAMRGVWPATVERATKLARVVEALPAGDAPLAVVLERGRPVGVIAVAELRDALGAEELPAVGIAADVMTTAFPTLDPDDSLYEALTRLERSGADALPVADGRDGAFLGVLTRAAVHERVVGQLAHLREQLLREHAGLAAFEEQSQLVHLLSGLPAAEAGTVARIPVDAALVGRSLGEVDFRRTRGGIVLAIQTADHRTISPPDPARPLRADDRLVVLR
jgi:CIC family chloride channel protein